MTTILRLEPELPLPIPVEDLCSQLDIESIQRLDTDGFEGGLITDLERSAGIVLVRDGVPLSRRRFTIGHELGHFLVPTHMPNEEGRFLCSRRDMRLFSARESNRRARMEVEANRFSALLLMPPPYLRRSIGKDPNIEEVFELSSQYLVSKEAMARSYAEYHPEHVAFVVVQHGRVLRVYKPRKFPFITARREMPVPSGSIFHKVVSTGSAPSQVDSCYADTWIDVERGAPAPALYEQVCLQAKGFALIMLWLEQAEEDERDDERTAKQRWKDRISARFV
ncbi:ImmA/IrrE family metallo-endopeptidase [Methyloligella sp. 2.7D]|uniref:ImmA/IrrE family metallo-endopeptidase n=1 Tax=unclassified Methyloligella TaxID=2625955 RepID=UPI001FEF415D|nr:ImmA/IrrE family metallo-endopeptidase [Methyloligella sp. GL2]